jgi:hypothetical protein
METQNEQIEDMIQREWKKTQEQQLWWDTERKFCQKLNRPDGNIIK